MTIYMPIKCLSYFCIFSIFSFHTKFIELYFEKPLHHLKYLL